MDTFFLNVHNFKYLLILLFFLQSSNLIQPIIIIKLWSVTSRYDWKITDFISWSTNKDISLNPHSSIRLSVTVEISAWPRNNYLVMYIWYWQFFCGNLVCIFLFFKLLEICYVVFSINSAPFCIRHNYLYLYLYESQFQNLFRFNCWSVKVITFSL